MIRVPLSVLKVLALEPDALAFIFAMARRPPAGDPWEEHHLQKRQMLVGDGNDPTLATCPADVLHAARGLITSAQRDAGFAYLCVKASALGPPPRRLRFKHVRTGQKLVFEQKGSKWRPSVQTSSFKWAPENTHATVWEDKLYVPESVAAFASENKRPRRKPHRVDLGGTTICGGNIG